MTCERDDLSLVNLFHNHLDKKIPLAKDERDLYLTIRSI
jgi:hypothetical protein